MASQTKTLVVPQNGQDDLPEEFAGWSRVYCPSCGKPTRTYFRIGQIYTNCEGCRQYFQTTVLPIGWERKLNRAKRSHKRHRI